MSYITPKMHCLNLLDRFVAVAPHTITEGEVNVKVNYEEQRELTAIIEEIKSIRERYVRL